MSTFRRFLRRLAAPFRSARAEHDLAREIRAHLRLLEDRLLAALGPARRGLRVQPIEALRDQ